MYVQSHFLFAYLISLVFVVLGYISHLTALLIGVLAVVLDVDHYIDHIIRHKTWSMSKAWNDATVRHEPSERTFVHHTFGFVLVTIACGILFFLHIPSFLVLSIFYYSHMILDWVPLNIFNIKGMYKFRIAKFSVRFRKYEAIWDVIFLIGVLVLLSINFI